MKRARINTTGSDSRARIVEAVRLREQGLSYIEIAERLGFKSGAAAYEAVRRVLEAETREAGIAVLDLELRRLDRILAGHLTRVDRGDPKSTELAMKILDRRARYSGLDKTFLFTPAMAPSSDSLPTDPAERLAVVDAWLARTRIASPSTPPPSPPTTPTKSNEDESDE